MGERVHHRRAAVEDMHGGADIGQVVEDVDVEREIEIADDDQDGRQAERRCPNRPQSCGALSEQLGFEPSQCRDGRQQQDCQQQGRTESKGSRRLRKRRREEQPNEKIEMTVGGSIQNSMKLATKRPTVRTQAWTALERIGRKREAALRQCGNEQPGPVQLATATTTNLTLCSQKSPVLPAT